MQFMTRRQFTTTAAGVCAATPAFSVEKGPGILREYARDARLQGSVALDGSKTSVSWTGPGSAEWSVEAPKAGEYEVALGYACGEPGSQVELKSGESSVTTVTRPTAGVFQDPRLNFELIRLDGRLKLRRGSNTLAVNLTTPNGKQPLRLSSVELTATTDRKNVAAEQQKARAARSSTDWFVKSAYGVMFHWTAQSKSRHGAAKPYADAVRDFPVESFIKMVRDTGAGHVLFTLNHAVPHCPAPIQSWEKYHPGMTTQRDLIGELADGLNQAGLRFLLYINSPTFAKITEGPGPFSANVDAKRYVDMHREILDEIGHRYARKLDGYWFDSWYQAFQRYPDIRQDLVFQACKAGNPDRITAFNFWILPCVTPWQEYWAGEIGSPGLPPASRFIERGAGAGLQSHFLLFLDAPWVHSKPETEMEEPHFSADRLGDYIQECKNRQAVVTVNLGIYQDGTIGPQAAECMAQVRRKIRGA
jgi:Alpha-L-fucosidase